MISVQIDGFILQSQDDFLAWVHAWDFDVLCLYLPRFVLWNFHTARNQSMHG